VKIRVDSTQPQPGPEPSKTLADCFSILHTPVAVRSRCGYHPVHETRLAPHRPARGALPYRSLYHPAHTGCDRGRPNRMDALSDRMSSRPRGPCMDGMELDRHGLRHLWNGGIGIRPCHSDEHPEWKERDWNSAAIQCNERDRELLTDPVRWARVFPFVPGDRASRIPSSQSSVPFFIRKTLIRSNPASASHVFVSAAE